MATAGGKPGMATAVNAGYVSQMEDKKASYWKKNSSKVPGSIKAVHSRSPQMEVVQQQPRSRSSPNRAKQKKDSFADFDDSTSDAWEVNDDDELMFMASRKLSMEMQQGAVSAHAVPHPAPHADSAKAERSRLGHGESPQERTKSVGKTVAGSGAAGLDERITSVPSSQTDADPSLSSRPVAQTAAAPTSALPSAAPDLAGHPGSHTLVAPRPSSPIRLPTAPPGERHDEKTAKFWEVLSAPSMEMDALRKHSWAGIPKTVRPTAWKVLLGYLPANTERRQSTLDRKREEYFGFVDQYYETRHDAQHKNMFHQIHIDIPRTNPLIPLFQEPVVQEIFERILYIWALKHPASGYVQGINDLVTPFLVVFLSENIGGVDIGMVEKFKGISRLARQTLREIEADSFWCMSKLLDGIQDNYTFAQPGIQLKVAQLKELIQRINAPLHKHLMENQLDYLQFAFRWMNNLLMREFPLSCTVRLWDTYMSEPEGFAVFHLYVCAAVLEMFAAKIMREKDFQGTMLFLQNLPTQNWGDKDISLLVAEAYKLQYMFADAPRHLNQQAKR